jgi:hypothetical protein
MTLDQWTKEMSKQIFLSSDEDPKAQNKFLDLNMADQDLEAEKSYRTEINAK